MTIGGYIDGMDFIDLYERGSAWTATKVKGAAEKLDAPTPCEKWKVRDVVNHLLDGSRYFQDAVQGKESPPPAEMPDDFLGNQDAARAHADAREKTLDAFRGADLEKSGFSVGIAFCDQLIHGWDIAKGTGQDATMPSDLAEAAYGMLNGRLTDETRARGFDAEVTVPDDAPAQDKLLGYVGRDPSS